MEMTIEELRHAANEQCKTNEQAIKDYIKSLTDKPCNIEVTDRTYQAGDRMLYDYYIKLAFCNEDSKEIFASSFDATYCTREQLTKDGLVFEDAALAMDCGSSGLTTRKDNPGKVWRVQLMAALWDREEEFSAMLKALPHDAIYAYRKERSRLADLQREAAMKARADKTAEIEAALVAGYEFTEDYLSHDTKIGTITFKVDKVTPKRVYFTRTLSKPGCRYKYDNNSAYKFLGTEYGMDIIRQTCYVAKSSVIHALVNGGTIDLLRAGENYLKGDFIFERFEPSNQLQKNQ